MKSTGCAYYSLLLTYSKAMTGNGFNVNLQTLCNEGASNLTLNRPQAIKLLAQVRRAPTPDQLDILKWIVQKFPVQTTGILKNINK